MGRRGRGRGRGRGGARGGRGRKKVVIESDEEEEQIIESCETIDNLVDLPDEHGKDVPMLEVEHKPAMAELAEKLDNIEKLKEKEYRQKYGTAPPCSTGKGFDESKLTLDQRIVMEQLKQIALDKAYLQKHGTVRPGSVFDGPLPTLDQIAEDLDKLKEYVLDTFYRLKYGTDRPVSTGIESTPTAAQLIEKEKIMKKIKKKITDDVYREFPTARPGSTVVTQDENIDSYSEEVKKRRKAFDDLTTSLIPKTECDYNMEDISQLVAPTFSTLSTGPPLPMQGLKWDQKYVALGERIPSPNVHMCEICRLPIRIYGRLIPCKHIFCYACALNYRDGCPRCHDRVHRVETSQLGTVFMCSHEGTKYGFDGCRRTYLSQRDLQAHINHRHRPRSNSFSSSISNSSSSKATSSSVDTSQRSSSNSYRNFSSSHSSARSNLISVPLHGNARMRPDTSSAKYGTNTERPSSTSTNYNFGMGSRDKVRNNANAKWGGGFNR